MNILAIGNSFSQDASRYIHRIARADGFNINFANLYIGGCSLERHFRNMKADSRDYELEYNGECTQFRVSLREALLNRQWDYVSIQQASHLSYRYETYQPYLDEICNFVRSLSPKAKLIIHQTWAYENGSGKLSATGYETHSDMFRDVEKSYEKASKDIKADIVIPSGKLMEKLLAEGISSVHRDGFHLKKGLGRYSTGLLWYTMLSGNDIEANSFYDFDEEITSEEISIIKKCVKEITADF